MDQTMKCNSPNMKYNSPNMKCNGCNIKCNGSNMKCNGSNMKCNGSNTKYNGLKVDNGIQWLNHNIQRLVDKQGYGLSLPLNLLPASNG